MKLVDSGSDQRGKWQEWHLVSLEIEVRAGQVAGGLAFGQQDIESNVYQNVSDKVHGDFSKSAPLVSPKKEIEELQSFHD